MPRRIPTFRPPGLRRKREARPSSHARGYGSENWQKVRAAVIARDVFCRSCGRVCGHKPGDAQVDHVQPKATHEAAEATPLSGLQLLCRSCHSRKTALESR